MQVTLGYQEPITKCRKEADGLEVTRQDATESNTFNRVHFLLPRDPATESKLIRLNVFMEVSPQPPLGKLSRMPTESSKEMKSSHQITVCCEKFKSIPHTGLRPLCKGKKKIRSSEIVKHSLVKTGSHVLDVKDGELRGKILQLNFDMCISKCHTSQGMLHCHAEYRDILITHKPPTNFTSGFICEEMGALVGKRSKFCPLRLTAPHDKPHVRHRASINLFLSLCPDTLVVHRSHLITFKVLPLEMRLEYQKLECLFLLSCLGDSRGLIAWSNESSHGDVQPESSMNARIKFDHLTFSKTYQHTYQEKRNRREEKRREEKRREEKRREEKRREEKRREEKRREEKRREEKSVKTDIVHHWDTLEPQRDTFNVFRVKSCLENLNWRHSSYLLHDQREKGFPSFLPMEVVEVYTYSHTIVEVFYSMIFTDRVAEHLSATKEEQPYKPNNSDLKMDSKHLPFVHHCDFSTAVVSPEDVPGAATFIACQATSSTHDALVEEFENEAVGELLGKICCVRKLITIKLVRQCRCLLAASFTSHRTGRNSANQGPDQTHLEPPPTPVILATLFKLSLGHTRNVGGFSSSITCLSKGPGCETATVTSTTEKQFQEGLCFIRQEKIADFRIVCHYAKGKVAKGANVYGVMDHNNIITDSKHCDGFGESIGKSNGDKSPKDYNPSPASIRRILHFTEECADRLSKFDPLKSTALDPRPCPGRGRENHRWPQDFCTREKQPRKDGPTAGTTAVSPGMLTTKATRASTAQHQLGITMGNQSCLLSNDFRQQPYGTANVPHRTVITTTAVTEMLEFFEAKHILNIITTLCEFDTVFIFHSNHKKIMSNPHILKYSNFYNIWTSNIVLWFVDRGHFDNDER
ncbi:hypothetical protein EK904_001522 [Melospiza melodia maxima]|nr:hypothetical protein EK904_001522 [Melospiza melodia maxima]